MKRQLTQGGTMSTTAFQSRIAATRTLRVKTFLEWGGIVAGAVLIAFGVVSVVMGVQGRSTVTTV
jgi:hypothetical protein